MRKWIVLFILFSLSEPVFAMCNDLAALARTVENSVAEAASDRVKVEFSWGRSAYDNAIVFGNDTEHIRWQTKGKCLEINSDWAGQFLAHESSWFVRINQSMENIFNDLLPRDDFLICHARFDWTQGPWGGTTYDFVHVQSTQCQNVGFSFGTKEKWEE